MRHNNIGGIMLSSLDMDDFTGMFCTGDHYPLLNTIHKQLLAPLPKQPRSRKGKRRKHVTIDVTRTPTSATTGSVFSTAFPTTNFNYEFVYETTTEIPIPTTMTTTTRTTVKSIVKNERRNELQQANARTKESSRIHPKMSKGKEKIQKKESQKQTATSAYFESLANIGRKHTINGMEGNRNKKHISHYVSPSQFDVTTINQLRESTEVFTTNTTLASNASQESELKNFLKNAADLPSHSLINGIMKLLGNNGHSHSRRDNLIITNPLPSKIATSTKATSFETTTEAIIRSHVNEPDISIADMRILTPAQRRNQRNFDRGVGNLRKPVERFIDNHRDIFSGQNGRQDMRIPKIRNDLTAREIQPKNDKPRFEIFSREERIRPLKPKELVPPPFPLPDMKEARPSKSFLDMKDLGFLA